MSSSDDDDFHDLFEHKKRQAISIAADWYARTYCIKLPCRTSILQGPQWVQEITSGNPTRIFETLRMSQTVFMKLKTELLTSGALTPTRNMGLDELLAIFLFTVSHSSANRDVQERFQRSGETISRHDTIIWHLYCLDVADRAKRAVHRAREASCSLAGKYIRLPDGCLSPLFETIQSFFPFSKTVVWLWMAPTSLLSFQHSSAL